MHVLKCFEVFSDKSELVFVKTKNSPQDLKCKTSMFAFSSVAKGRMASPKVMIFWKSSKRPLIPPPHFRKIMLRFFSGIHDRRSVYNGKNLQHKFLDWK